MEPQAIDGAVTEFMSGVQSNHIPESTIISDQPTSAISWEVRVGIPRRYRGKSLANFDGRDKPEVKAAIEATRRKQSVIIIGPAGTGKTHLGVGLTGLHLATHAADYDVKHPEVILPRFVASVDFFARIKRTYDHGAEEKEADIISELTRTNLLVFDDLGAEKISDWSRQLLYQLIDRRYRDMKPTIITTNLTLEQIAENIDDRISSRIVGSGVVMKLSGNDRRLEKK